jgi:superfamily II DNA helicase RecQ
MDKEDVISGFEHGDFPCISCTMALGLGQNWKCVRRVIHIGQGDPSCICQMIGRCGRDGRDGLAVLLVEPKRKFGLNTPEAIRKANKLSNNTRMDSLAITPVCLRIAFSVDNLSVLLTPTEFVVIEEVLTEIGF